MPTHNRADVLGFAITSVLAQSDPDFELLIVADGCTDRTRDVVASFSDPRIRFFDLPKAPYVGYANRNVALRQARGKLIAFAAHDDLLLPNHLALMGDLLDRSGVAWGYSRPLWVSTDGIIVPFCTNLGLADEMHDFLERGNTIPANCVVHSREALEQVDFWPEDVPSAADWELWRRILAATGGSAAYLRQPTTLHFSANWRQSRFSAMAEVRTLLAIADSASWWPAILRHGPGELPEQAALWRQIEAGGGSWVLALRTAIDTVIDRVAWMTVREFQPRLDSAIAAQREAEAAQQKAEATAEAAAAALRHQQSGIDAAHAAQTKAEAEVRALLASTSWRLTAPLRGLAQLFRR